MKYINRSTFVVLVLLAGFTSCNEDEPILPKQDPDEKIALSPAEQEKVTINNWIYNTMKEVYYWTSDIPAAVDSIQDPTDYFYDLLSPEDRFSVIVPDYEELLNSLSGVSMEAGYEFALAQEQGTNNVLAVVLYVKNASPADQAGLDRGDIISEINGTTITLSNYRDLIAGLYNNHSIKYRRFNEELNGYEDKGTVELNAVVLAENPNYLDTVYTIGSNQIGYYVYNFFSPGTDNSTIYDNEMNQIIAAFKNEGVDALIIDLRYNSGGAGSSARNLASLIGPGVNSSNIFYKNQYNGFYQDYFESQSDGGAELQVRFKDKPENIGNQINGEVYILTGSRTASASELVINGLDPYMNVTIIGDTTVGKNVGSIPIQDTENTDNNYGLLPIVVKVFNSDGHSDYDEGFSPLSGNLVSDFQQPLKALGDIEEPLLARAIELITGTSTMGRKYERPAEVLTPIMTSIDLKERSNRLILEERK